MVWQGLAKLVGGDIVGKAEKEGKERVILVANAREREQSWQPNHRELWSGKQSF
jgi:hypothetical protein